MFMRTTLQPARHSLFALPTTYCEFEEPSSPCTMMAVGRDARTSVGCQWQSQLTRLAIWLPTAGETSTSTDSAGGSELVRGRKLPRMVCRWAFEKKRRGANSAACAVWLEMDSSTVAI